MAKGIKARVAQLQKARDAWEAEYWKRYEAAAPKEAETDPFFFVSPQGRVIAEQVRQGLESDKKFGKELPLIQEYYDTLRLSQNPAFSQSENFAADEQQLLGGGNTQVQPQSVPESVLQSTNPLDILQGQLPIPNDPRRKFSFR